MRICLLLMLSMTTAHGAEPQEGMTYIGAWWHGVSYSEGEFKPAPLPKGPPPLRSHEAWRTEPTPDGTLIRVGDGYLSADEKGRVHVALKRTAGSFWVMKKVGTESREHRDESDWTGSWERTTYTLVSTAPGLRDGKLGIRNGELTLHPENEGLAILAQTHATPRRISGR